MITAGLTICRCCHTYRKQASNQLIKLLADGRCLARVRAAQPRRHDYAVEFYSFVTDNYAPPLEHGIDVGTGMRHTC